MKLHALSLVFAFSITHSSLAAINVFSDANQPLSIEYQETPNGSLTLQDISVAGAPGPVASPAPSTLPQKKAPKIALTDEMNIVGVGMLSRYQKGNIESKGLEGQGAHYQYLNLADGSGLYHTNYERLNFNVFSWENNFPVKVGTSIEGAGNASVAFSFNYGDNGNAFYVGASGDFRLKYAAYSQLSDAREGYVGLETGLHSQGKRAAMFLSSIVSLGGQNCTVTLPNGNSHEFSTNEIGFGGIARIVMGKGVFVNAFYMAYPEGKIDTHTGSPILDPVTGKNTGNYNQYKATRSGSRLNVDVFMNLNSKLVLTGNCSISRYSNQESNEGPQNSTPSWKPAQSWENAIFKLGFIQRFY
jgi:hypothetical protein